MKYAIIVKLVIMVIIMAVLTGCSIVERIWASREKEEEAFGEREEYEQMDILERFRTLNAEILDDIMTRDDPKYRIPAIRSLPRRDDISLEERIELLVRGLEHEITNPSRITYTKEAYMPSSITIRKQIVIALTEFEQEAVPILQKSLDSLSYGAREYIILILAHLGDGEAALEVRNLINQASCPGARENAVRMIGRLEDRDAIPQLIEALQDPYITTVIHGIDERTFYPVREQAYTALKKMNVEVERIGDDTFEIRR